MTTTSCPAGQQWVPSSGFHNDLWGRFISAPRGGIKGPFSSTPEGIPAAYAVPTARGLVPSFAKTTQLPYTLKGFGDVLNTDAAAMAQSIMSRALAALNSAADEVAALGISSFFEQTRLNAASSVKTMRNIIARLTNDQAKVLAGTLALDKWLAGSQPVMDSLQASTKELQRSDILQAAADLLMGLATEASSLLKSTGGLIAQTVTTATTGVASSLSWLGIGLGVAAGAVAVIWVLTSAPKPASRKSAASAPAESKGA